MNRLEFDCKLRYPSGTVVDVKFETEALVTGLLGPSGTGKTSVLSMIAGLRSPTTGHITFAGQCWFDDRHGINIAPEKRRVGYVLQEPLLFPHLSVRSNLNYGQHRRVPTQTSVPSAWQELIELLEIGNLLDRLPSTLSGGQQRRVAIGRAILAQPRLLLLDEPLNSLDADRGDRVLVLIQQLVSRFEIPVIMVTHQYGELASFAAKQVWLG